jgi:N-acetylmuramoyl-L-alanine amidase
MSVDAFSRSILDAGSTPAASTIGITLSVNLLLMKKKVLFALLLVSIAFQLFPLSINIRSYDHQDFTRIVFQGDQNFQYNVSEEITEENAFDVAVEERASVEEDLTVFKRSKMIHRVSHRWEKDNSIFRVHMKSNFKVKRSFVLEQPYRLVFDVVKAAPKEVDAPPKPKEQEKDTGNSQEDPQEETGEEDNPTEDTPEKKKRIVIDTICIDPGHGGTDFGAVGKKDIMEKDITLNVSKKLKRLIESKLGLTVVMTRISDEEISLNSRVSKANNRKAQLFVSIHVNSSFRKSARGPETYYVSLKATDQEAFKLSQKENSSFEEIGNIAKDDDLKLILWNMAQTQYIKESSKLADFIQYELNVLMHTRNRGVKQAPFRVLMRAEMPAVLVEVAFLSNNTERKKLSADEFLGEVASSIYKGISKYIYYHNNMYK